MTDLGGFLETNVMAREQVTNPPGAQVPHLPGTKRFNKTTSINA